MPLVGPSGLEPPTSRLSGVRSNHLSYEPVYAVIANRFGGDGGDRTHDLLLARQALSQLSYTPIGVNCSTLVEQLYVGVDLSSRTVARKVLSTLVSLTSVFGMGTGGPSPFETPTIGCFFALVPEN